MMTHSSQQWPEWLPIRSDLSSLTPYGAPQLESKAQLNTNENPFPPSAGLVEAIGRKAREVGESLNRYPDRDAVELRKLLATFMSERGKSDFSSENIWAANGSNEVIQSIFLAFGGSGALGFVPSYSMHPLIAQVTSTDWVSANRENDFSINASKACEEIRASKSHLIFITTPNNPTGTSVPISDLERIAQVAAEIGALLIIDEAYAEFSQEDSATTLIEKYPHVLVVRTMSKAFAFAGARVGYLVAHPKVVDAMKIVRLPYHLSAMTQAIAMVALEHRAELLLSVDSLITSRNKMADELGKLGVPVLPSSANFLLFEVNSPSLVWKSLLDEGVLIRDVGLSGYLRVTIGNEAENALFISALKKSLGGQK
jgi:histidinol-phosphate aminotransferase